MRLIHTSTFALHEFQGSAVPHYAILSHRWLSDEVTFHDMQSGRGVEMAGFEKIRGCCSQAASEGWQYVWIDSCCIDKSSSAELSEAINSMFRWYEDAQICYAYLSDVPGGDKDPLLRDSAFRESKWFTRGWTLQELLAPSRVVFYNHDWIEIGTKSSLYELIAFITHITKLMQFKDASIAQKMSWASRRETTREEDLAYCLMGLFGVNMPPLYGEGKNAFQRLQLEILSKSDDESIFAWQELDNGSGGLLARSPAAFRNSGDILQINDGPERPPFSMTNKGLRIELLLSPPMEHLRKYTDKIEPMAMALINCHREGTTKLIALGLAKRGENQWFRALHVLHELAVPVNQEFTLVYIPQHYDGALPFSFIREPYRDLAFLFRNESVFEHGFQISHKSMSRNNYGDWNERGDCVELLIRGYRRSDFSLTFGALRFLSQDFSESFIISVDADNSYNVGLNIFSLGLSKSSDEREVSLSMELESHYERLQKKKEYIRKDRVSLSLDSSGTVICAFLAKKFMSGEIVYVIDITSIKA